MTSNEFIEDLGGLGGRNVAVFNNLWETTLNVSGCQFLAPECIYGRKKPSKKKIYCIFAPFSLYFQLFGGEKIRFT